jgi:hypothetical protein
VRRNLASYTQEAVVCRAELIPTEAQLRAATTLDARASTSTTAEGEGFCTMAVEIYATKTKEEEMVQELLKDRQKGAHGYIPEVNEDDVIQLGCENVNSLSHFHPTKSKMRKLTNLHQRYQTDGACKVKHSVNFKMVATGTRPEDLFPKDRGSGPKHVIFQMVPKSFLSVLIHSTRCKYNFLDFLFQIF